jgi:curved DNA-binding protein CbpA
MQEHYDRLGIAPGASLAEIKAAYHGKLKEFPAHKHPQEFKAIRAAYEALQKGGQDNSYADFFKLLPTEMELDPVILKQLRDKATAQAQVSLDELMRLTY